MASSTVVLKVVALVVLVAVAAPGGAEAAVTCGQVVNKLMPCLSYVQNGGAVPPACCGGVKAVNAAATNTQDRQTVCNCLKQLGAAAGGAQLGLASSLPGKCGVSLPFPITNNVNCSKVK